MTTPPKRLSFAQEMELLKQQKAEAAERARQEAEQRRLQMQAHAAEKATSGANLDTNTNANANAPQDVPHLALADAAAVPPLAPPPLRMAEPPRAASPVVGPFEDRIEREKAMAAAFSQYISRHQSMEQKSKKSRASRKGTMMFCTSCLCTTPGEHVKPGNAGIGMALGMVGLIPGLAYLLYRQVGGETRCTHCQAATLVAMNSVQARTLCGDQHAALMEAGWPEMRRAEQMHTRARRIAMGKVLVVAVVILGASLFLLRSPTSPLQGAAGHELRQKIQAIEMMKRENGEGVE